MKKIISAILIGSTLTFCSVPALAANSEPILSAVMSPQFSGISILAVNLTIDSGGCAHAVGQVIPAEESYSSTLVVTLQQSTSTGWTNIKSWNASNTGRAGVTMNNPYFVAHGTYRTFITASVFNSSGQFIDLATEFSDSVTY